VEAIVSSKMPIEPGRVVPVGGSIFLTASEVLRWRSGRQTKEPGNKEFALEK